MALGPTHGPPDGAAETEPGQKAASQCSGPQRAGPTEHRSRFSKEAAAPLCSARCPCVPSFNPRPPGEGWAPPWAAASCPGRLLKSKFEFGRIKNPVPPGHQCTWATRDSTAGVCHCTASAGPRWAGATATLDPGHTGLRPRGLAVWVPLSLEPMRDRGIRFRLKDALFS